MRIGFLIVGIGLAAVAIFLLNYFFVEPETGTEGSAMTPDSQRSGGPVSPQPSSAEIMEETPPSPVVEEPAFVLPELERSDPFVRDRLAQSRLPEDWLGTEDLVRRFSVVIENATRGEIPRRQLAFLAPEGKFQVREQGDRVSVDPASYARYDRYLDMLESVPPESLTTLLIDTAPLFEQALLELGEDGQLLPRLLAGIDQVLAVPVIEEDIELVQPRVYYEYADPALESLSELQKQVLRMGPANVQRLKAYLLALRVELMSS